MRGKAVIADLDGLMPARRLASSSGDSDSPAKTITVAHQNCGSSKQFDDLMAQVMPGVVLHGFWRSGIWLPIRPTPWLQRFRGLALAKIATQQGQAPSATTMSVSPGSGNGRASIVRAPDAPRGPRSAALGRPGGYLVATYDQPAQSSI